MKTPHTLSRILVGVFAFTSAAMVGFALSQQLAANDRPASSKAQAGHTAQAPAATTKIAHVEVARAGAKTIVKVEGNGPLSFHPMRLTSPDRLALDFAGARLALAQSSIPSALPPVHSVRAGQFQPGVARIVIDLETAAPYRIASEGNSITVEFDAEGTTTVSSSPAPQKPAAKAQNATLARRAEPAAPSSAGSARKSAPEPAAPRSSSPASPASPGPAPFEGSFQDGLMTFRVQNQTLASVLKQIAAQSGVSINMVEGVGNEQVSVEFQHFRVDEALKQMLKDYDAFFFYGMEGEQHGTSALKAVWVFPRGLGREFLRARLENGPNKAVANTKTAAGTKDVGPLSTNPDPAVRAQEIENLIRRKGRDSTGVVLEALKDESDKVRSRALYRALITGAPVPQETLVNLVLKDDSPNVRFLALQALPINPDLRWVAERAVSDSSQSVSQMAQDILNELDAARGVPAPAGGSGSQQPPRP